LNASENPITKRKNGRNNETTREADSRNESEPNKSRCKLTRPQVRQNEGKPGQ